MINNNSPIYYPICPTDRNDIHEMPQFNKKYKFGSGLTNQLFAIINGIIKGKNADFIIIDGFGSCIENGILCPIRDIIDLQKTTEMINKIPPFEKIKLIDRSDIHINLVSAFYGLMNVNIIDVTKYFENNNTNNNWFCYLSDINFNKLFGIDPCPDKIKKLYLCYQVNNYIINTEFDEYTKKIDICQDNIINLIFQNKYCDFLWYTSHNEELFVKLLNSLVFSNNFLKIINHIRDVFHLKNCNIIQLRVEDDGIEHWSRHNKMSKEHFSRELYAKYKILTNKYFDNGSKTLILTGADEKLYQIFGDNNFIVISKELKLKLLEKYIGYHGRELRALIDLLLGISFGINFIGCHSHKYKRGSSFGYFLSKKIKGIIALIDLDCIHNEPEIYNS